jgi:riboflavin synthase
MFGGLIAYRGTVVSLDARSGGATLRIACEGASAERPGPMDSIAIDGVCLTATSVDGDVIAFDVVPETLACTTLGVKCPGERVNVEYSLRVGDRMGGHYVYGHVDAVARVLARSPEGNGERVRIERPRALAAMICKKAFVAVDGVSLTVAVTDDGWFEIALVPETLARTALGERLPGSNVNVEVDPIARYVASCMRR